MKKITLPLASVIFILSGLVLAAVLVSGSLFPPNNLLQKQMIPALLVLSAVVIAACFALPSSSKNDHSKSEKVFGIVFYILLAILGFSLFFSNFLFPFSKASLRDYAVISANAECIATGKEMEVPLYYVIASNNFKPTLVLAFFYRLAFTFGMRNPQYLTLFLFTVWTVASIMVTCLLIDGKQKNLYRLLLLLSFILMLPLYVLTGSFYTDTMTFGTCAFSIYLIKKSLSLSERREKRFLPLILSSLAGIILAIGIAIKITVIIPIIAAAIVYLFKKLSGEKNGEGKPFRKILTVFLPFFVLSRRNQPSF